MDVKLSLFLLTLTFQCVILKLYRSSDGKPAGGQFKLSLFRIVACIQYGCECGRSLKKGVTR
jgi:hypothetical protein